MRGEHVIVGREYPTLFVTTCACQMGLTPACPECVACLRARPLCVVLPSGAADDMVQEGPSDKPFILEKQFLKRMACH